MPSFDAHAGMAFQSLRGNPWQPSQFLMTSSQHFGVIGSGKVYIVNTPPVFTAGAPVSLVACWGTPDGAFDACFSELDQNVVVVASGDGVRLYAVSQVANRDGAMPLVHNQEHQAEVSCVCWHSGHRDFFFSCSWDCSVRMFSAAAPQASISVMLEHHKEVYEVATTAASPSSILSCSGDGTWKLWDTRATQRSVLSQVAHDHQIVLSIDFNKKDPNIFATGGVDRTVRLWDARRPNQPLAIFPGHEQACRRVRFSYTNHALLASSGYDMRVCIWDLNRPKCPLTGRYQQHREFVTGLDWSRTSPDGVASASFDGSAFFWSVGQAPSRSPPLQLPLAHPPPRVAMPRKKVLPGLPPVAPPLPLIPQSPR